MQVRKTAIADALIIEPDVFSDQRGFFTELYQDERYASCGVKPGFVQDNLSRSACGVLRGLHFQAKKPQGKLVTVLHGAVLDVVVDIRVGSPTFGVHIAIELNDENRRQVWVPRGLAHGFLVLSESADFFYKCDNPHSPADEVVLCWNDPALAVQWGCQSPTLSPRDRSGRTLAELKDLLPHYQAEGCEYSLPDQPASSAAP
jgi:dTDP-4-dehydrorhamnose 3,5-epimerase